MLSHTSGFQDWRSEKEPLKIHFTPGEKYLYSGEGYAYLQSVATRLIGHGDRGECGQYEAGVQVCATDMDAFMKTNVLEPFGMNSSNYLWTDAFQRRLARPHDAEGKPMAARRPTPADVARYGAAGGLLTTPTDYAKFPIEVIHPKSSDPKPSDPKPSDPKSSDPFRLSKASLKEMLRPQIKVSDGEVYSILWALGWQVLTYGQGRPDRSRRRKSRVSMHRRSLG